MIFYITIKNILLVIFTIKFTKYIFCAFSKNILTNIEITGPPVVRSALKPSQVGFDMYRFGWCEREVRENYVARERLRLRF